MKILAMKKLNSTFWHPMTRFPRNAMCPCQSGNKFKFCCSKKFTTATIKADKYETVRNFVRASRNLWNQGHKAELNNQIMGDQK